MGKVSVDDKYIWNFLKLEINFNVETIKAVSEKKKIKKKNSSQIISIFFLLNLINFLNFKFVNLKINKRKA